LTDQRIERQPQDFTILGIKDDGGDERWACTLDAMTRLVPARTGAEGTQHVSTYVRLAIIAAGQGRLIDDRREIPSAASGG
jgi:hypothetical protein